MIIISMALWEKWKELALNWKLEDGGREGVFSLPGPVRLAED